MLYFLKANSRDAQAEATRNAVLPANTIPMTLGKIEFSTVRRVASSSARRRVSARSACDRADRVTVWYWVQLSISFASPFFGLLTRRLMGQAVQPSEGGGAMMSATFSFFESSHRWQSLGWNDNRHPVVDPGQTLGAVRRS